MSAPVMQPSPEELRMLAKQMGAVLPQNVSPWSYQLALESAFIPFGTSLAAAIVACCLYFLFFCAGLANYFYTKYPFYDVLCISTACESLACVPTLQPLLCGARGFHWAVLILCMRCSQNSSFCLSSCLLSEIPAGPEWHLVSIQQCWLWCKYCHAVLCNGQLVSLAMLFHTNPLSLFPYRVKGSHLNASVERLVLQLG